MGKKRKLNSDCKLNDRIWSEFQATGASKIISEREKLDIFMANWYLVLLALRWTAAYELKK